MILQVQNPESLTLDEVRQRLLALRLDIHNGEKFIAEALKMLYEHGFPRDAQHNAPRADVKREGDLQDRRALEIERLALARCIPPKQVAALNAAAKLLRGKQVERAIVSSCLESIVGSLNSVVLVPIQAGVIPAAAPPADPASGMMSVKELAEKHDVDPDALRKRLERWMSRHDTGYIEVSNRAPRDPKFVYDEKAILPLIKALKTSSKRPAK